MQLSEQDRNIILMYRENFSLEDISDTVGMCSQLLEKRIKTLCQSGYLSRRPVKGLLSPATLHPNWLNDVVIKRNGEEGEEAPLRGDLCVERMGPRGEILGGLLFVPDGRIAVHRPRLRSAHIGESTPWELQKWFSQLAWKHGWSNSHCEKLLLYVFTRLGFKPHTLEHLLEEAERDAKDQTKGYVRNFPNKVLS